MSQLITRNEMSVEALVAIEGKDVMVSTRHRAYYGRVVTVDGDNLVLEPSGGMFAADETIHIVEIESVKIH